MLPQNNVDMTGKRPNVGGRWEEEERAALGGRVKKEWRDTTVCETAQLAS